MGHCVHPLGLVVYTEGSKTFRTTGRFGTMNDVRLRNLAERSAWDWARQYALTWTPLMDRVEQMSEDSYVQTSLPFGVVYERRKL
jgi:hypothetical protein